MVWREEESTLEVELPHYDATGRLRARLRHGLSQLQTRFTFFLSLSGWELLIGWSAPIICATRRKTRLQTSGVGDLLTARKGRENHSAVRVPCTHTSAPCNTKRNFIQPGRASIFIFFNFLNIFILLHTGTIEKAAAREGFTRKKLYTLNPVPY